MTDLTKFQPSAGALSMGYALNSIELAVQTEQQQYQLSEENVQMQGKAALAQSKQAYSVAKEQSNQEEMQAFGQIFSGAVQGAGLGFSLYGANKLTDKPVTEANENLANVTKWDNEIKAINSGKTNGADLIAAYKPPQGKALSTEAIRLANGSEDFTDGQTPAEIALLKTQDPKAFETLANNVSANKKSLESQLSDLSQNRLTFENRIKTLFDSGSGLTQGSFTLAASVYKTEEAKQAMLQQLAQFQTTVANGVSSALNSAIGNSQSMINSMSQNLIGGPAQANMVRG